MSLNYEPRFGDYGIHKTSFLPSAELVCFRARQLLSLLEKEGDSTLLPPLAAILAHKNNSCIASDDDDDDDDDDMMMLMPILLLFGATYQ